MNADKLLDEIAIGISWVTITLVLILYVLGINPSRADTPTVPISISQMLVASCAEMKSTERQGNVYRVRCIGHTGKHKEFVFRIDAAGALTLASAH